MGNAVKYTRTLFEPEHELFRESYRGFLDKQVKPFHDQWEIVVKCWPTPTTEHVPSNTFTAATPSPTPSQS